jgi:hypothetical protein
LPISLCHKKLLVAVLTGKRQGSLSFIKMFDNRLYREETDYFIFCIYAKESSIRYIRYKRSRDSSVDIVTGYELDCRSPIPSRGKICIFSTVSRPALGPTQPPIQWVSEAFPGVKRHGAELIKHRDNFIHIYIHIFYFPVSKYQIQWRSWVSRFSYHGLVSRLANWLVHGWLFLGCLDWLNSCLVR